MKSSNHLVGITIERIVMKIEHMTAEMKIEKNIGSTIWVTFVASHKSEKTRENVDRGNDPGLVSVLVLLETDRLCL